MFMCLCFTFHLSLALALFVCFLFVCAFIPCTRSPAVRARFISHGYIWLYRSRQIRKFHYHRNRWIGALASNEHKNPNGYVNVRTTQDAFNYWHHENHFSWMFHFATIFVSWVCMCVCVRVCLVWNWIF